MTPSRRAGLALAAAGLVLATGCSGGSSGGSGTDTDTSVNANGCTAPSGDKPDQQQYAHEPKLTIARTDYTATITTNCGEIVLTLDGKHAPHTVNSFAFLAAHHYFDNTPCHRLTTSGIYVLQCGDPTGTGSGDPGYSIPDENLKGARYPAGTVAMANAGANTGGSQFFIVYDDTQLDANYTPFGTVSSGLDVVRKIAAAGSDDSNYPGDGAPKQPVVIESFTVAKAG